MPAAVLADPKARISAFPLAAGRPAGATDTAPAALPAAAATASGEGPAAAVDELAVVVGSTFTANPVLESLTFWMDQLELPVAVRFAPYNQLFQQVLDPASATAENRDGVNVALLRMEDWSGPETEAAELGDEFTRALEAFQRGRGTPFVVVLCPPAEEKAEPGARWRARLAAGLAGVERVLCVDTVPMLELYGVGTYRDPISEQAGHIPYTPEFFAALGTCLARQLAALVSEYPSVVVIDGNQFSVRLAEPARRLLTAAAAALAGQGREVFVVASRPSRRLAVEQDQGVRVWTDERPLLVKLDAVARETGVPLSYCAYLSGDEAACAAVLAGRPDIVVLPHPLEGAELETFLEHTWLLDPPGVANPGAGWWRGKRR